MDLVGSTMKNFLAIFVIVGMTFTLYSCGGDNAGGSQARGSDLSQKYWKLKSIKGNRLTLSNGKRLILLGVYDNEKVEEWLRNRLQGKVRFQFDSQKTPRRISRSTEYYAYVQDETGADINAELLRENISIINTVFLHDSLEVYRQISASGISASGHSSGHFSVEQAKSASFLVQTFQNGNKTWQGSGFFISDTGVGVSNHHVFEDGDAFQVQLCEDDAIYQVTKIYAQSEEFDFVIFQVGVTNKVGFYRREPKVPHQGDKIYVYGNPTGLTCTLTTGIVSALRGTQNEIIQVDAAISPGSSGSPVLNEAGNVIGIATLKKKDCENCNFAMNIQLIEEYLPR